MLSLNLESIADDDLFGSGAWNPQNTSTISTVPRQPPLQSNCNNMTIQNGAVYDASSAPVVQISSLPIANPDVREGRVAESPPQAAGESQSTNQEPVVRPKEYRNRNGRSSMKLSNSKNINTNSRSSASNPGVNCNDSGNVNRDSNVASSDIQYPSESGSSVQASFEPVLRKVRYDNNGALRSIENKPRKVPNNSKQRKDDVNMRLNQNVNMANSGTNGIVSNFHLPYGLNQTSNTAVNQGNRIYLASPTTNPGQNSDVGTQSKNSNMTTNGNSQVETSVKVSESPNYVQYKNSWQSKVSKPDNTMKENNSQGAIAQSMQTDIETDSDQPTVSNTTFLRLEAPANLPRTTSGTDLTSRQIVVPYEHQGRSNSDSSLQLNYSSLDSLNALPISPINTTTTLSFTQPTNASPIYSGSNSFLPSNLPSTALFGDGVVSTDNDFQFAQELQLKYDRENEASLQRNGYDVAPSPTFRARGSQSPQTYSDGAGFSSLDFVTDSPSMMDTMQGLENNAVSNINVSLYNRQGNSRQSSTSPHRNETSRQNDSSPSAVVGSDRSEDQTMVSRLNIPSSATSSNPPRSPGLVYIPLSQNPEDLVLPEPLLFGHSNIDPARLTSNLQPAEDVGGNIRSMGGDRRCGDRGQERTRSMEDESLARRLQEEQDEELARMLQAQEENRSGDLHYHSNHYHAPRGQPLHSLIDTGASPSNWLSRPLRVGQSSSSSAINNNVSDSRTAGRSRDRPLQVRRNRWQNRRDNLDITPLDYVQDPVDGYDIPPSQDYYYRYEYDPDYMQDEPGEDRLISINRDPQLLASLLMTRAPNMMIPSDVDLNDYEALWELAENLGEVRRVGMEQEDISLLPVHTYQPSASGTSEHNKTDCLVCMCEFEAGEQLRTLPCCHIYHLTCIDEWLRRNAICPICRQPAK